MTKRPPRIASSSESARIPDPSLRKRAEEKVTRFLSIHGSGADSDSQLLIHELQVHQIELEMQNEELRRAQRELEETQARYCDLYDNAPAGYFTVDKEGMMLEANLTGAVLLGVSIRDLIHKPLSQFIFPEDQDIYYLSRRKLFSFGERQEFDIRMIRPGGVPFWAQMSATLVRNAAGLIESRFMLSDVAVRKNAEESLRKLHNELEVKVDERTAALTQANRRLKHEIKERIEAKEELMVMLEAVRDLYEHAPCGYHSLDKDGVIVRINDTELNWLGYRREELLGRSRFRDLVGPGWRTAFDEWSASLIEQERCNELEIEILRKNDSSFPAILNATVIRDADGKFVMTRSTVLDISQRKRVEQEALRAAHLASIGELAAGVAHEINNPVNSIINYAQILVNKLDKRRAEYEFCGEIVREGERIAMIVNSLLTFSRKSKDVQHPTNVRELLLSTLVLMNSCVLNDSIHLQLECPQSLPDIMAVPQQIRQVFLNVIANARYALNRKYPGPDDKKILKIRCEESMVGNKPIIRTVFLDHGIGISSQILEKVTEPFYTTKPGQEGTGLGLSICQNIILKHGGDLKISSEEGNFTEVTIILPAIAKEKTKERRPRKLRGR